ncbi:DoxX family protein [Olivibacter sp. CPCC 100613]|uniref:DoxX family protein n=1 Tax=Olivibacter sp. CPCC 100613 TaxID=3079931 RepID=UPI002FFC6B32
MENSAIEKSSYWSDFEKIIFRFLFIYLLLQALPLDWKYWRHVFTVDWLHPTLTDLFNVSRYTPQLFSIYNSGDYWGLNTFVDWAILAATALIGTVGWSFFDRRTPRNYDRWYYFLRVILRYRLALGVIAYGFLKLFPLQSPAPTLSDLNTPYGDLSSWKIFSLSLGVAPSFESFLGLVEIIAGLLLLYRKTVFVGTFILLSFTGNVFLSNLAYEGGEAVYSLYLIQFALVLLAYDAPRLYTLLTLERTAVPVRFKPKYQTKYGVIGRKVLKVGFLLLFVVLYGQKAFDQYQAGGYQLPTASGLLKEGFYDVSSFVYDGKELDYGDENNVRWQNVVIEKWPTLSIQTRTRLKPAMHPVEVISRDDADRTYEFAGNGARRYYRCEKSNNGELALIALQTQNKLTKFSFTEVQASDSTVQLIGQDNTGKAINIHLRKIDKKYLLEEAKKVGRRSQLIL